MNVVLENIKTMAQVEASALREGDAVTLDVPGNRIVIRSQVSGIRSIDVGRDVMRDLVSKMAEKEPGRDPLTIISIIATIIGTAVTILGIVMVNNKKCTRKKTTVTYEETTTYSDGRTTTRKYTETSEETDCDGAEENTNPPSTTPPSTPPPAPGNPQYCPLCGEQLVPGKRHYCK